jgi:hypothetical protein
MLAEKIECDCAEAHFRNWQSEFPGDRVMAVLSISLRQRAAPEAKPVGAPHVTTDESGCTLSPLVRALPGCDEGLRRGLLDAGPQPGQLTCGVPFTGRHDL